MAHAHPHQTRTSARLANPGGALITSSQMLQPPPPTPILKPAEVKKQFSQHADFAAYSKSVKKFLSGSITKTEFHAELAKILPTKEKRTSLITCELCFKPFIEELRAILTRKFPLFALFLCYGDSCDLLGISSCSA